MPHPKPTVGQTVYIVPSYFHARTKPYTGRVTKVGREYFYVDRTRYLLTTWGEERTGGSAHSSAYPSKAAYDAEMERPRLIDLIRQRFYTTSDERTSHLLSIESLRQIEILSRKPNSKD